MKDLFLNILAMVIVFLISTNCRAETGKASWYGPGFNGRRTASGERFNMNAFTAAHRTLKFGSRVKVTNLKNRKSVVVRINDRGPYVKGRVMDLSKASALAIGVSGVAAIEYELLK